MRNGTKTVLLAGFACVGAAGFADAQPSDGRLAEPLAIVQPLLGSWRVDGTWAWGAEIAAEAEYRPILGGVALANSTWVSDNGGPAYERYRSVFRAIDADTIEGTTFAFDGSVQTTELRIVRRDGGAVLESSWSMDGPAGEVQVQEELGIEGDRVPWTVRMTPPGESEPSVALEAVWLPAEERRLPATTEEPALTDEGLRPLEDLLGTWTIEATWADGSTLDATNEYRLGVGGMFIEVDTLVSDNGGEPYQRYHSVYDYDPDTGAITAIGFDAAGGLAELPITMDEDGRGYSAVNIAGPMAIEQTLRFQSDHELRWIVEMGPADDPETRQVMIDGVWKRSGSPSG